ncbi:Co-chaperone protein hscB [Vibrio nigripulchritudo MADA3029]|uniref:Co-chaperone protein HscB homolog n=2 Tax=Vibrio nigripulchritudo TaxID=28173 RepID=U4K0R7_9VIBR|nr:MULTISPECIES: co-chaperone HscB [Vibrio]KJY80100.1 cobalamin 5'-phosphate synthase [Vibrio nigripulchritudo]UAB69714.1 co-chaperone HscB [Vibrio sp. SCSIO 43132]CCN46344.1 Co-chaperone protein hscB [Vibrio nigripulchritudo MADA3020]CCN53414.1 Co-chaperone protein hscB [Vibrio nigripulchritudo MADA3021]CCN58367.1 Co-chaperone protein hscB [Vibrio nigripulchritudo MADA3029]
MDHFELFGISRQFDLDVTALSTQFRELQRQFHPDKFATSSERDRLMAVQKAAQINDAFQVLKQPISRAEYLLSLKGVDIRNEQNTMQDPMFLMEQMELREALEEIESSSDPESELFDFEKKVSKLYQSHLDEMVQSLTEEALENAANGIRKLKFIAKLQNEIEQLEEKLFA